MKNKKSALDKMQEAYLDAANTFANKTYKKEGIVSKRIFNQVKKDMVCKIATFEKIKIRDKRLSNVR